MAIDVEACYKKYGPMVYRRCKWILRNHEKAMDAMQEVFVNLLQHSQRLSGDYPSSLLYRIATNICLNVIRAEKRRPVTKDEELMLSIAGMDDTEGDTVAKDLLERIFQNEVESTRVMAFMHYVDRMTLEEVAQSVGLSVSGVRKRLRVLKERVSKMGLETLPD